MFESSHPRLDLALDVVRDTHFHDGVCCPRCACPRTQRWGGFKGRQRYRCLGCMRTFSDLTGTPAAYIKKLDRWLAYVRCLKLGLSVRRAAACVDVNPTTAFRWRHRLLAPLGPKTEVGTGWVEIFAIRIAFSEKGRHGPGFGAPSVCRDDRYAAPRPPSTVYFLHDRSRHLAPVIASHRPNGADLVELFHDRMSDGSTVCAPQGRLSPIATSCRRSGRAYLDVRYEHRFRSGGRNRLVNVVRARKAAVGFIAWMRRFHGVATKYLINYLNWFVLLDRSRRMGFQAELLRWPL